MSRRSNMKKEIDMLNGSLWSKIILFALPIVTTSIVEAVFMISLPTLRAMRFFARICHAKISLSQKHRILHIIQHNADKVNGFGEVKYI